MDSYPITNRSNMFGTTLSIVVLAILCATVCNSAELSASSTMSAKPNTTNMETTTASTKFDDINYNDVMNACNATFKVSMEYLAELNSTGSFPDETDKTPMCYIKCYLEGVGILTADGAVMKERAISMLWPNSADTIDACINDLNDREETCEMAYYLARCVMIKELVSGRITSDAV